MAFSPVSVWTAQSMQHPVPDNNLFFIIYTEEMEMLQKMLHQNKNNWNNF